MQQLPKGNAGELSPAMSYLSPQQTKSNDNGTKLNKLISSLHHVAPLSRPCCIAVHHHLI
jgi:hypothetical protein